MSDKYYSKYAPKVLSRVDKQGLVFEENPDAVDEEVEAVAAELVLDEDRLKQATHQRIEDFEYAGTIDVIANGTVKLGSE